MIRLFVPGRLCLFGEHSDWAGELRAHDASIVPGACILTGTDQGITATAAPATDFEMLSRLPGGAIKGPFRVAMDTAALEQAAAQGGFFSYAAGVAAALRRRRRLSGVSITVTETDLPIARGLSSSAAICVITARAFNQVHALRLSIREEMDLAYHGELAAGSQCGRMDQACAYGKQLVRLGFDGLRMHVEPLQSRRGLYLLVVDLRQPKDTRRILADLHRAFHSRGEHQARLRRALGDDNLDLIARARPALEAGDAPAVGALMAEAQACFDHRVAPACPSELTAPRLHALLDHPAVRALAWGGKGVGSQGDGAAQIVCRGPDERRELAGRLADAFAVHCLPLSIPGAGT